MTYPRQLRNLNFNPSLSAAVAALAIALLLIVVASQPAQAQTYDAAADFEQGFINQTNPNAVWSYGYSSSFTTPITLYDQTAQPGINGPNAQFWISSVINYGESPSAEFNDGQAYDDGNVDFLPYEFLLVSGIAGQYSDLVFTAPASGMYSVTGSFRGCQYGIGVVVGIVVNGNVIFNSTVSSEGQIVPFDTNLSLAAGDTVIFSVGPNGGLQNTGVAATITSQPQNFAVLHNFTGGQDGANPKAGVTLDKAGNLYGTTFNGGTSGNGAVYQLKLKNSSFVFNPLYSFAGGSDGANPDPRVISARTALSTARPLKPELVTARSSSCNPQRRPAELYSAPGRKPSCISSRGILMEHFLDMVTSSSTKGNIYGTTYNGGYSIGLGGTVYEMTPSGSSWTESVLYRFSGSPDGQLPSNAVAFDSAGNLYSTTEEGGSK